MRYFEKTSNSNPMNNPGYRAPERLGLGDAVQKLIHAGLDITPMPAATRAAIKGCSGCARRKARLNKMVPNLI